MARVEELADHPEGRRSPRARPYYNLIPLTEIIGDAREAGANSKGVLQIYFEMLSKLGNELFILQEAPIANINKAAGALIAEGIERARSGRVTIAAGYDGEYGTISIFSSRERKAVKEQLVLF